ncbi:F-box protein [Melia azedarach]|uniref:F-box protein n=1 Tax=Melia azedarach TaxID=155640 RepID=A0ACC1YUX1_MELAZ|nr:F-box protein [Melia azedarach]
MENRFDFLNWLAHDMSIKILTCLEDISDIARVSCVSRSWRQYVIANGLSKQLCLKMFPQLSQVDHVVESTYGMKESAEVGSSNFMEWRSLEREHRAYAFLARGCTTFPVRELILEPICASSTDNYPEESIHNTLEPRDRVARRASYWSSKGQSNPAVPETLLYKLAGDLCVINEVSIQPFQAYFQWGLPIYSAKTVRFRMGYLQSPVDDPVGEPCQDSVDDKFICTYTSQEFPMAQENRLQKFKFPEPVLCIGGFLQIELLGRVQRQEMDGLILYMRVSCSDYGTTFITSIWC